MLPKPVVGNVTKRKGKERKEERERMMSKSQTQKFSLEVLGLCPVSPVGVIPSDEGRIRKFISQRLSIFLI